MYKPEHKELYLKIDTRMIVALKQFAGARFICGNSMDLPEKLMYSIVKAIDAGHNDLTLTFGSDNPNFRGF